MLRIRFTAQRIQDELMDKGLPQPVKNLRKIWDKKKVEMRFTQVEAAKELGWSQGAISHYLNNITELRAQAVIKLANFLDVDPREIDPDIEENLPSVIGHKATYSALDVTKPVNLTVTTRRTDHTLTVHIPYCDKYKSIVADEHGTTWGYECYVRLISPSQMKNPKRYAARLKGKKSLEFYSPSGLPEPKKIHTLWSVVSFHYM